MISISNLGYLRHMGRAQLRFSICEIPILFQATPSRPAWADAGFRWYAAAGRRRRAAAAGCRQGGPDWTGRLAAAERRGDSEPPRYRQRGEELRLAAAPRHPPGAAARRPDAAVCRPAQNECRRAPVRSARHLVPADWRRHWRVRPGPGLPPMSGREAPSRPRSIVGIAEATVKTRMFYAREKLADFVATA